MFLRYGLSFVIMFHSYDYFSSGVSFSKITDSLRGLAQRVAEPLRLLAPGSPVAAPTSYFGAGNDERNSTIAFAVSFGFVHPKLWGAPGKISRVESGIRSCRIWAFCTGIN